jgi:CheY-like chemotaxis protein
VLEGTKTILENWHYTVSTATGLEQALNIISTALIDIIISDFSLEGTDGIKAIEALREKSGNTIPALLITGDTAPERIKAAKDSGMILLHKPVNIAKLRTALHFQSDTH